MERVWLESKLAEGQSIEAIAKEVGKQPSTVGYWVKQHGLPCDTRAEACRRGGVDRETLAGLVERGPSGRQIGEEIGLSFQAIRYWLKRFGPADRAHSTIRAATGEAADVSARVPGHGWTDYVRTGPAATTAARMRDGRVATRRRRIKEILVAEAGGRCRVCGYDIYIGALQFHHVTRRQAVRGQPRRDYWIARFDARGGPEMRATVRKLPRGGGSRTGASGLSRR